MPSSFRQPFPFERRAPGAYVDGHWKNGEVTSRFTVMASVQPARISDYDTLQANVEGRRIESAVRIYTDDVLVVSGYDDRNGDRLLWPYAPRPGAYVLMAVSSWQSKVISHYRYLAVLEVEA